MIIKNKKKTFIILLLLILIVIVGIIVVTSINRENTIEIIQFGPKTISQMMGYAIKTKNTLTIIDGGTSGDSEQLVKYIKQNGNKVDYWFLTHTHSDHAGAFVQIMQNEDIEVKNIYVSLNDYEWYEKNEPSKVEFTKILIDTLKSEKLELKVISPKLNEKFEIDQMKVEILGIKNPEITLNPGNEQSMVIRFDTKSTSLLILGDTGEKSSEKLLESQKEKLNVDIVQMSHHGQKGATEELYKQINPTICLWPTPDWLWDNNEEGKGKNTRTLGNVRNKRVDGKIKCK